MQSRRADFLFCLSKIFLRILFGKEVLKGFVHHGKILPKKQLKEDERRIIIVTLCYLTKE